MPITPEWLSGAAQDYVGRIGDFGQMDPNSFVAPASPLQRMAWDNVGSLSGWQGQANAASQMAQNAGQGGANLAGRPQVAQAPQSKFSGAYAPDRSSPLPLPANQGGPAYQAQPQGYSAPQLGNASLVSAQGYQAPNLGNSQGYAAARVGQPIGAQSQSYGTQGVNQVGIAPTANASATGANAGSLLDNFSAYQNPWNDQVVNTTLRGYDNDAAQRRAQLEAQGARNGAFGGSRFGIAEGQFDADTARDRAAAEAQLRQTGFNTAAGLSQSDAANRQQTSLFNAQNQTGVSLANAGAENQRALAQAGFDMQGNLYNADAQNQAAQFGAGAANTSSMFNAAAGNQANLTQAGLDTGASQFGAGAANDFSLANAGFQANAGQFNANALNQAAGLNAGAQNQFAMGQAGLNADASQFGAAAGNQANLFNAGANNQMSQFNAGQQDSALNRQLQAAGMLGGLANDYGSNTRADLGTMSALGDQQRQIEQSYQMAPLAQLQAMGQLSGMTPYDILVGRQTDGTSTGHNVGTQTSTPSLFNQMMGLGSLASGFGLFGGGGGK